MWLFRGKPALIRWTIIQFVFISISVILKKHSIREYSVYLQSYFSFIPLRATGRFHNSWQNVILWLPETCHLPYKHPGKKRNPQNPGCGRRDQAFSSGVIIIKILHLDTEAAKDILERTGKGCFTLLPEEKAGWKVRDRNPEEVSSVSIDIDSFLFLKA